MHTLGNDTTLRRIAAQLADKLFYPLMSTCCAFAGDRGLLHEELTRSATHDEAREVMHQDLDLFICANRTCEVGMEHATRGPYESFVYALEKFDARLTASPAALGRVWEPQFSKLIRFDSAGHLCLHLNAQSST
jgi:hypothetical protein